MSKSYYLYINSKNRNSNENIYNFNVYLNNPILCNQNEALNVNVIGFSMLNSDYNCRGLYFKIRRTDPQSFAYIDEITYNIPDGNYNYLSLTELLNNIFNGDIKVEYVKYINAFKFTKININYLYFLDSLNCDNILGVNKNLLLQIKTDGTIGSYINLVNYSHIIVKSNSLSFDDNIQDNITYTSDNLGISNILFMLDKQDIQPFHMITYNNQDKGDNFNYNISNKIINSIDLQLYNEKNELLTNTSDYIIILKFNIIPILEESAINNTLPILEDIRFIIMNALFNENKNILL